MARRIFVVTDEWQIASPRQALFEIIQEPQEEGHAILFNDVPDDTTAERIPRGNKGLPILQPLIQNTYVKSAKPDPAPGKGYKLMIED